MKPISRAFSLLITIPLITGCLPKAAPAVDPGQFYTVAAQTIEVQYTLAAMQATLFAPSATVEPATQTPLPVEATLPLPSLTLEPMATETVLLDIPTDKPQTATPTTYTETGPMIMASQDTNCRSGPGGGYSLQSNGLLVGMRVPVRGRISTNTWWLIQNPDDPTRTCWVWSKTTSVDGNIDSIPVIPLPPTLTPDIPKFRLTGYVMPATYSGPCPVTLTLAGTIYTDMITDVTYRWTSSIDGISTDWADDTFEKKEKHSYTASFSITKDTSGSVRFRTNYPVEAKTDQIPVSINCD